MADIDRITGYDHIQEELDRLRAENERLRKMPHASDAERVKAYGEELDRLRAEREEETKLFMQSLDDNAKLQAENERLRAYAGENGWAEIMDENVKLRAENEILRDADHSKAALEALRAEIEQLRELVKPIMSVQAENAKLMAIIKSAEPFEDNNCLRAENERLREALREFDEFAWSAVAVDCEEARQNLQRKIDKARKLLQADGEGK